MLYYENILKLDFPRCLSADFKKKWGILYRSWETQILYFINVLGAFHLGSNPIMSTVIDPVRDTVWSINGVSRFCDFLLWAFALAASTNVQRRRLGNLESLYRFGFWQNRVGCLIKYTSSTGLVFCLETCSGRSMAVHYRQTHLVLSVLQVGFFKGK